MADQDAESVVEKKIVEQVIQRWETITRESFDDEVQRRAFCLQQAIAALQLRFSDDREGPERVIETAEKFLAWMTQRDGEAS